MYHLMSCDLLETSLLLCRYSGILSAYGLALADVVYEAQEPCAVLYEGATAVWSGDEGLP